MKKSEDEKNWTNLRASMYKIDAKCKLCRQCAHTHLRLKTLGNLIKWQILHASNAKQIENKKDASVMKDGF